MYIKAALLAEGFIVTRARIRACIRLIDPEGAVGRRRPRIERGSYYVPGPMFMWYIVYSSDVMTQTSLLYSILHDYHLST